MSTMPGTPCAPSRWRIHARGRTSARPWPRAAPRRRARGARSGVLALAEGGAGDRLGRARRRRRGTPGARRRGRSRRRRPLGPSGRPRRRGGRRRRATDRFVPRRAVSHQNGTPRARRSSSAPRRAHSSPAPAADEPLDEDALLLLRAAADRAARALDRDRLRSSARGRERDARARGGGPGEPAQGGGLHPRRGGARPAQPARRDPHVRRAPARRRPLRLAGAGARADALVGGTHGPHHPRTSSATRERGSGAASRSPCPADLDAIARKVVDSCAR